MSLRRRSWRAQSRRVVHIFLHQWGKRKHQNRYYYYITYFYYTVYIYYAYYNDYINDLVGLCQSRNRQSRLAGAQPLQQVLMD
jgi:hypothetical protein